MIKNDASHIFAKYLSEDASCSIGITDHLRKSVIGEVLSVLADKRFVEFVVDPNVIFSVFRSNIWEKWFF